MDGETEGGSETDADSPGWAVLGNWDLVAPRAGSGSLGLIIRGEIVCQHGNCEQSLAASQPDM